VIVDHDVHEDDELAKHLQQHLNIPLDWPVGGLTVGHVANIAVAAACDVAYDQAAGSHLLDLLAALPLPGDGDGGFWQELWTAAGSQNTNLHPTNVGPMVRFAAAGEGGLADHILSFINELNTDQRGDTARLIGSTLSGIGSSTAERTGELWLRDAEITAWRVLLARHQAPKASAEFFHAWRNA
jgi:hypothetical protein